MAITFSVSISHIDTCLPCYLQDHHNREGEVLLGVPVTNEDTYRTVLDGLRSEWDQADYGIDCVTNEGEAIEAAFDTEFEEMSRKVSGSLDKPFDSGLDGPEDYENGESAYAWFLVTFQREDDDAS